MTMKTTTKTGKIENSVEAKIENITETDLQLTKNVNDCLNNVQKTFFENFFSNP